MFKKIFTDKQVSLFFQVAIFFGIISFALDILIYHFFSHITILKMFTENLNNLSIFMGCLTVISRALRLFTENHEKLITKYKILGITVETCLAMFLLWLITIEGHIKGKFIIFLSSLSQFNHSYRLLFTLLVILSMLIFDLYRNIINPPVINKESVRQMLHSTFQIVIKRHVVIFIFIFAIVNFITLHKFSLALLHYSESSLLFNLSLLEIIIPIIWIAALIYHVYQLIQSKNNETGSLHV